MVYFARKTRRRSSFRYIFWTFVVHRKYFQFFGAGDISLWYIRKTPTNFGIFLVLYGLSVAQNIRMVYHICCYWYFKCAVIILGIFDERFWFIKYTQCCSISSLRQIVEEMHHTFWGYFRWTIYSIWDVSVIWCSVQLIYWRTYWNTNISGSRLNIPSAY